MCEVTVIEAGLRRGGRAEPAILTDRELPLGNVAVLRAQLKAVDHFVSAELFVNRPRAQRRPPRAFSRKSGGWSTHRS